MKLPVTVSRAFRFAVLAGVVAGLTVTPAASQGQPVLTGKAPAGGLKVAYFVLG